MLSPAPTLTAPPPARLPAPRAEAPPLPLLRWQGADTGGRGLLDCSAWPGELVHLGGGSRAQRLRVLAQAAGLEAPGAGRCQLLGRPAAGQRWAADTLAHVLRDDPLPPRLPVPGFVAAPLLQDGIGVRDALMRAELELYLLGASQLRQRAADSLSPTEARLARLARAMVTRPALLVLAWPDQGLPAAQCMALRQALLTLACTFRSCVLLTSEHPRLQASADRHIDLDRLA
jgi:predicted ABC-type transport system involved in lysophospholipase L1 biosynthesis ATPase subunit